MKLNEIIISNPNETKLSINNAIKTYRDQYIDTNWLLYSKDNKLIFKRNLMNTAKLQNILQTKDGSYQVSISFENNDDEAPLIIEKSYDDFCDLFNLLTSNEMKIKFENVLKSGNNNDESIDLTNEISQFFKELLIKCRNKNDSLLLIKVYDFISV